MRLGGKGFLLFARVQPTIVANKILSTYEVAGYDRLKPARQVLATNTCLTFHELSFPKREMDETEASIYQSSSHLFLACARHLTRPVLVCPASGGRCVGPPERQVVRPPALAQRLPQQMPSVQNPVAHAPSASQGCPRASRLRLPVS